MATNSLKNGSPASRLRFSSLILVLLVTFTAAAQAQFETASDGNGGVIVTGYTGSGGAVSIPGTINNQTVTGIGANAFQNNNSLTSVTLPGSLTSIGQYAFEYCSNLAGVTISDSVISIGQAAFDGCTSLSSVTLPNSVTSLAPQAFDGCTSLYSVTIGSGVTGIGDYAFEGCTSLTSVTIPASVTSIGLDAFYDCSRMTSATFLGNAPSMGSDVFEYTPGNFEVEYYSGASGFATPTWTDSAGNAYTSVELGTNSGPFDGVSEGGDWYYSSWFGTYNTIYYPWIYRSDLGFIYVESSNNTDIDLYVFDGLQSSMGWLYTNATDFPNVYSFTQRTWLYFFAGGDTFYNYTTKSLDTY